MQKVVFSRTVDRVDGKNIRVHKGDVVEGVNAIKRQPGKDIVVYGGATFVSSLLEHNLIDELNLFVNPTALGNGLHIFKGRKPLKLETSSITVRDCRLDLPNRVIRLRGTNQGASNFSKERPGCDPCEFNDLSGHVGLVGVTRGE